MSQSQPDSQRDESLRRAIEITIRLGIVIGLAAWCFNILRPFITPVVWGIILAVAIFPAYRWLMAKLGDRGNLAAVLFTVGGLLVVILPSIAFTASLVESGQELAGQLDEWDFKISPPSATVADWPIIGPQVFKMWSKASENLADVLADFTPQLKAVGGWLFSAGAATGMAVLQSLISIVIAGVMLAGASSGSRAVNNLATRLAGPQGERFAAMASATVRSVAVGIVGVAFIQAGLIGIGLLAVGIPHATIWILLCLILAVLQLPPILVVIPIIFYVFSNESTTVAVIFTIWSVLASASDSVLKPILLARGVKVPMLVIFLGAIGGFMSSGFIGLFIGAVILSLGYELFRDWLLQDSVQQEPAAATSE